LGTAYKVARLGVLGRLDELVDRWHSIAWALKPIVDRILRRDDSRDVTGDFFQSRTAAAALGRTDAWHTLVDREGLRVNHKRVYGVYRDAGLQRQVSRRMSERTLVCQRGGSPTAD